MIYLSTYYITIQAKDMRQPIKLGQPLDIVKPHVEASHI